MTAEELGQLLDELGRRLGPTGEYVWQLAVRYAVTNAVVGLVFGVILTVVAAVAVLLVRRWARDQSGDDVVFGYMFSGFLWLPAGAGGLLFIGLNVVTLLNPEYAAIRDLLNRIAP